MHGLHKIGILIAICACAWLTYAQQTQTHQEVFTGARPGQRVATGMTTGFHQINWVTSGNPGACYIDVDYSNDGMVWSIAGVVPMSDCTKSGSSVVFGPEYVSFIRLNVTTLSSSAAIQVTYTGFASNPGGAVGAVTSVFGRTGAVIAVVGDYNVAQVTGAAPLFSPSFSGNPTAPTPAVGNNSNSLATTAFVTAAVAAGGGGGTGLTWPLDIPQLGTTITSPATGFTRFYADTNDNIVCLLPNGLPCSYISNAMLSPQNTVGTSLFDLSSPGSGGFGQLYAFDGAAGYGNGASLDVNVAGGSDTNIVQQPCNHRITNGGFLFFTSIAGSANPTSNICGDTTGTYIGPLTAASFIITPITAPPGCTATNHGQIISLTTIGPEYCDGTNWIPMTGGGGGTTGAVTSVFGRTGTVAATAGDYTVAMVTGAAPLNAPSFTGQSTFQAGTILVPTSAVGTNNNQAASTAFVTRDFAPLANAHLTGVPTAPTAAVGTNTTQLATTAFVLANAGTGGGGAVSSVFGRTGVVVAAPGDYSVGDVLGAAPLASPALTGVPTAPTAAAGNNSTQIATTAFVLANQGGGGGGIGGTGTANTIPKFTAATNLGNSLATDNGTTFNYTGTGGVSATRFNVPTGSLQFVSVTAALPSLPGTGQNALVSGPSGWEVSNNNAAYAPLVTVIGHGTVTVPAQNYVTNACALVSATTVAGLLTTDVIQMTRQASTAFGNGRLIIDAIPSAGSFSVQVCNSWSADIAPTTALVMNYIVLR